MGAKKLWILVLGVVGIFLISTINLTESKSVEDMLLDTFKKEYKPVEPLLPPDAKITPGFREGVGPVVGNAQMVQGKVYVVHKGETAAYQLKKDLPLYSGDILVAMGRSRLNAKMQDKSVFALSPSTKLVIDEAVYDPAKDERKSLISLLFGRARFIVAKLKGKSSYSIKTPTAVAGVRGSDFALSVTPQKERMSSNKNTLLSRIHFVKEAHAQIGLSLLTAVVTGPGTTVSFAGAMGVAQTVGPVSVSAAAAGGAASAAAAVGAAACLLYTSPSPRD